MKEKQNILLIITIVVLAGYIVFDSFLRKTEAIEPDMAFFRQHPTTQFVASFDIPENLNFAGESVPIDNADIRERFDREVHINTYFHSSTIFMIKRANRWFPIIEPILQKNGIPEDFKYLAVIESSLSNVVSPKDAVGFWQLMKGTAKENGLEVNKEVDERYHPVKSAEVACKFLKKAKASTGTWTNAAAAYNMGVAGLKRRLNEQQVNNYYDLLLNSETSRYVFRALALKEIMENPKRYGYNIQEEHLYYDEPLKEIEVTESIRDLVDFSNAIGINYKILKLHNPWLRKKTLTIRGKNTSYFISVPQSVSDELISNYQSGEKYISNNKAKTRAYPDNTAAPEDLQTRSAQPE